jgi:hypothetical protein
MRMWKSRLQAMAAIAVLVTTLGASPAPVKSDPHYPALPANGEMGFVVSRFTQPMVQEPEACPTGPSPKLRDVYLESVSPEERMRLLLKENEPELTKRWQAQIFGPNGTNICSHPDAFSRPLHRTVQSPRAIGLDLDRGAESKSCAQPEFVSPDGETGIDNQEYRAMGCTAEWRGVNGSGGEQEVGMRQFHVSGEWTQVILLRGVDSFERDDQVEVVYANTPDRPMVDSKGNFLTGASFSVSDKAPRNRNVLIGRIDKGVLTTLPSDIVLTQTWGQGGARDIRGNRTKWDYRLGRLRLVFQPDGSLAGLLGGYRPVFDVIQSPAIGGAGSAIVAGIDCASLLATLRKYADGVPDKKTGQCTAVSSAMKIVAVPAFVNDVDTAHSGRSLK